MKMDKRLVELTRESEDDYIFWSELQVNMNCVDIGYPLE